MARYEGRSYAPDGTYWVPEIHDDTTRTVTTYDDTGAVTGTRPYTTEENAAADQYAAQQASQQVQAALTADATTDLSKIEDAITKLAVLLGDNTTTGSIRAWKAPITNNANLTGAQGKALADLVIADAQATRRIARQTLRLARLQVGALTTADVGTDI